VKNLTNHGQDRKSIMVKEDLKIALKIKLKLSKKNRMSKMVNHPPIS